MPAKLAILTGSFTGQEFQVETPVIRISSDSDADISLPEMDGIVLTLRYRRDGYVLYNRSSSVIEIEGETLNGGESRSWAAGEDLQVNDQLIIQLQFDGDPAPARKATRSTLAFEEEFSDDPDGSPDEALDDDSDGGEAKTKKKSQNQGQIAMIVLCFAAIAYLLLFDESADSGPKQDVPREFHELIEQGFELTRETTGPSPAGSILRMIQDARIKQVRGHGQDAIRQYQKVDDILTARESANLELDPRQEEFEEAARRFVRSQLRSR